MFGSGSKPHWHLPPHTGFMNIILHLYIDRYGECGPALFSVPHVTQAALGSTITALCNEIRAKRGKLWTTL